MQSIKEFYAHPAVRRRLSEYCGGRDAKPETFTAEYVSGINETCKSGRVADEYIVGRSTDSFFQLLDRGTDIFRSVWDRSSSLAILDIEYFNLIYPAEAYFNPVRTFHMLESVCERIEKIFQQFGINTLRIMTGQGYHYSLRADLAHPVHTRLIELGRLEDTLKQKYRYEHDRVTREVPVESGLAFDGMGRLMEYACHLLLKGLGPDYKGIKPVCTDVAVGGPLREAVALDLSMYGDPLYMRDVRCPFSAYQKHKYLQGKFGVRAAEEVPVFITLPRPKGVKAEELIDMRGDLKHSRGFAETAETRIPDASGGVQKLVKSYVSSKLFGFHREFDSVQHDAPENWHETYDRLELDSLPECVAYALRYPNDNLLKPTNLQLLSRVLIKTGWHPKHIAGLVRSKLERDYGWGKLWFKYDAATRANFYIRLFSGLLLTGIDTEEDLSCESYAERGYCMRSGCSKRLEEYKI